MTDHSELRRKAEAANRSRADYYLASPAAILALLDELDAAKRNIELKDRALANMLKQSDADIASIADLQGQIAAIKATP